MEGLRNYLQANQDLFHRTLCTKLMGYALGRGESIHDVQFLDEMVTHLHTENRIGFLVERIVTSRPFRFQRGKRELSPSVGKSQE
ncbi:MAG: DUF1585 domain-containing protein [Planctomycetaceae bacterium]|nr:DUF1585 domain-containing protein [Planctomycetaceae bacterium]